MNKRYISVRRAKPSGIEKGHAYLSSIEGGQGLHYDAESMLHVVARGITGYEGAVVLRNQLPNEDPAKKCLDILVKGHNLLKNLSGNEWRREAQRVLRK
jgi:hypothetical protein